LHHRIDMSPNRDSIMILSRTLSNMGILMIFGGTPNEAVPYFEESISVLKKIESQNALITLYIIRNHLSIAMSSDRPDRLNDTLKRIDECLAGFESLKQEIDDWEINNSYIKCLLNKGYILFDMNRVHDADEIYRKAITLLETQIYNDGRSFLRDDLARLYSNYSDTRKSLGDRASALWFNDLAIQYFTQLAITEGHKNFLPVLNERVNLRAKWRSESDETYQ
jgi:tetratricopeptide (TPR) repeat protein